MIKLLCILLFIPLALFAEPRGGTGNSNGEEINGNVEIIESTNHQLTLTHTPSVNETTFRTNVSGILEITNTGFGTRFNKNISIGQTPSSLINLRIFKNVTAASVSGYTGILINTNYNHTTGTMTSTQYGLQINVDNDNNGNLAYARAFFGGIFNRSGGNIANAEALFPLVKNEDTGTITNGSALRTRVWNQGTGTITNGYGGYIESALNDGGGTFVNNYGLYIDDQDVGTTLNYAIYTNAGDVRLGDDLEVVGDIKQTVHIDDVSNPPTDAELDSVFGTPATVGSGFTALLDDNGADTNVYQIISNGTSWWIFNGSKAL